MKILPFLFLSLATPVLAEPGVTPIGRLKLLDGRTLKNAVIRSYDERASKVLIVSEGNALLIPITLIPPPYADKIKTEANRVSPEVVQPTKPGHSRQVTEVSDSEVATVSSPAPVVQPALPPPASVVPAAPASEDRKAHQAAAAAHARRYYKYEFRTGSNSITVTDTDVSIHETVPVSGWTNRFRTTGKIYLEIYDSVGGGSFRRRTNEFEILTEQKPGEDIKVIDFTRK
jgi:hypothetical protein